MSILNEFGLTSDLKRTRSHAFEMQTRCVTELFEANFEKFKNDNFWKILVECVGTITKPKPTGSLGVCTVQVSADLTKFFKSSPEQKKKLALDYLWRGVQRVVSYCEWDIGPFQKAHQAVVAANYANRWTFQKPKFNRSRTLIARAECEHDIDAFRCFLIVCDRSGRELSRKLIFTEKPSEFLFAKHLGRLAWKANREVEFKNKAGVVILSSLIETELTQ